MTCCRALKRESVRNPGFGKGRRQGNQAEPTSVRVLLGTLFLPEGRIVWHRYCIINAENSCWKVQGGWLPGRQICPLHTSCDGLEGRVATWIRDGACGPTGLALAHLAVSVSLLGEFSGDSFLTDVVEDQKE